MQSGQDCGKSIEKNLHKGSNLQSAECGELREGADVIAVQQPHSITMKRLPHLVISAKKASFFTRKKRSKSPSHRSTRLRRFTSVSRYFNVSST
jgi:hypothetical protein